VATTVPADWNVAPDQTVLLTDLSRSVREYGVSYDAVSAAARNGLLPVVRVGGRGARGGTRRISLDSALLALAIAVLCQLLKAAFTTVLRTVRESGGKLTPAGLIIPVGAA
jgi:hypothetical protein